MGAFDNFNPPAAASSGGAFDNFQPPPPAPQSTSDILLQHLKSVALSGTPWDPNAPKQTLGTTALWNKPANVSWGDYMAAHAQPVDDFVRAAANPFGLGDRFAAAMSNLTGVGGGDLAAQRAQSDAAAERDPSMTAAGNVVGALATGGPLGELAGGGSRMLAPYLAPVVGRFAPSAASRLAGGVVNAGATAVDETGRGEDLSLKNILLGGAVGTAVGAPTGGAPGPLAQSVAEAQKAESAAYFPTHSINFPMSKVSDAYYDAAKGLSKDQQAGLSPGFNSTVTQHIAENSKTATTSASEIDGFQRGLNEAARTNADRVLANGISENLDNVLTNVKPVTPSGDPDVNFAAGDAADLLAKAKLAASRRMNAEGIAEAQRVGGLPGGPGVGDVGPNWARGELKANPQFYADPDVNAAMSSVARAGSWLPPSYLFKHALAYPVAGAIAGGAHGYATGGDNPWERAGQEALEAGTAGIAASYGLPAARNYLVSRALTRAAPTLTAGAPFPPPSSPLSDAARRLIFGQTAFQR